jgi:uncharacterized GH25 family protein
MTRHLSLIRPELRRGWLLIGFAFVIANVAKVGAHDFWIEPSQFHPTPGSLVGLRLLVGQDMIGDPVPREPSDIEHFLVVHGTDEQPVPGRDGGDPAGVFKVQTPGLLIVGYQSRPRAIELPPDKFQQYLGEEGLDEIKSILADSARRTVAAHELFARCAKSLLSSGTPANTTHDRALGLRLELVAERNPYLASVGDELPFVLTYEGKPRAGALVVAVNEEDPTHRLTARSDRDGRVRFKLPTNGVWLVKAVHMIPAPPGSHADWQSFWASSTFELGSRSPMSITHGHDGTGLR